MSDLHNKSDIINEEDEFLKKSRPIDSDDEDLKEKDESDKPKETFYKSSPYSGFGIKSQDNNSEKIEINDEVNTMSNKEQNFKFSQKKDDEINNNNSFFKPSLSKNNNENNFTKRNEESTHVLNFHQSGFGSGNERSNYDANQRNFRGFNSEKNNFNRNNFNDDRKKLGDFRGSDNHNNHDNRDNRDNHDNYNEIQRGSQNRFRTYRGGGRGGPKRYGNFNNFGADFEPRRNNFNENNFNYNPLRQRDNFYMDNRELIDEISRKCFPMDQNRATEVLKILQIGRGMTIFELLNEFSRQSMINKSSYDSNPKGFQDSIPIFEVYERDLEKTHEYMIKYFKTKALENNEEDIVAQIENYKDGYDRRRIVKKNVDGIFNYLPIKCETHNSGNVDSLADNCRFAHSENEIKFHPLYYKTLICLEKNCENKKCPDSHGLNDDFRKIYDAKNQDIINLAIKFEKAPNFSKYLIKYTEIFPTPVSFSLETFKVLPCKINSFCGKDSHLCFNYHDIKERRRPPRLFKLLNEICSFAQPDKNADFYPQSCQKGDYCEKIHTRYELLYHEGNFRKIKQCIRPQVRGMCKYYLTCYGVHPEDNPGENESNPQNFNKKYCEELETKIKELNMRISLYACHGCNKTPDEPYYGLLNCNHLMCKYCLNIIFTSKNSCLKCQKQIEKGKLYKVFFINTNESKKQDSKDNFHSSNLNNSINK